MPYNKLPLQEKIVYITPDGTEYVLHAPPTRTIISIDGLNLPSQEIRSVSGPYQHGERAVAALLGTRSIQVTFRHNGYSRGDHWSKRYALADILRINRTSNLDLYSTINNPEPGQLRFVFYQDRTRVVRDIDVYVKNAIVMPSSNNWDNYSIQETFQFTALNPVFYDPDEKSAILTAGANVIDYDGNWEEYPRIVINGDVDELAIVNTDTGYYFLLDYAVGVGEIVTVDLTYGLKSITNQLGDNLLSYLTPGSNLINFNLVPDPMALNGNNVFNVAYSAGNPTITLYYFNRYVGI